MHPVLFTVGGFAMESWTALVAVAFVIGIVLGIREARRDGFLVADLLELAFVVVLSALLGSKLFHVLFEARGHKLQDGTVARGVLDLLRDDPWHWARLLDAGAVFYGGVLAAVAAGLFFCWRRKLAPAFALADAAVPGILLGIVLGRFGCLLGGCCYGAATAVPWAIHFPTSHETQGALVHPTQLYDMAFGAGGLLTWGLLRRRRRFAGEVFVLALLAYAPWRFLSELFRGDADRGLWGVDQRLSTSQVISIIVFGSCLILWRLGHLGHLGRLGHLGHLGHKGGS